MGCVAHGKGPDHGVVMRSQGVADLVEETVGIGGVLQGARESYTGQELERNCRVFNEGCVENLSVDLKQLGLMRNGFDGRNQEFFVGLRRK